MQNKTLKYSAAACFVFLAVRSFVILITSFSDFYWLSGISSGTSVIGGVMAAVALIYTLPKVSAVGFGVQALPVLIYCGNNLLAIADVTMKGAAGEFWLWEYYCYLFISNTFFLLAYVFLMLAGILPKKARTLGIMSAGSTVLNIVSQVVYAKIVDAEFTMDGLSIANYAALIAGAVLLGIIYYRYAERAENEIKVSRLKRFLDKGILTQEEFDAKKQQLLGM